MKIGTEDFEALIRGREISLPIWIGPFCSSYSVFGVKNKLATQLSRKSYLRDVWSEPCRKLAVQAVRKLFHSVGMGAGGLNNLLKKSGWIFNPQNFLCLFLAPAPAGVGCAVWNCWNPVSIGLYFEQTYIWVWSAEGLEECPSVVFTRDG